MSRGPGVAQLVVLGVVGILLSVMELMFQFAYIGSVPIPLGTLVVVLTMPWLVRATVETWPSTAGAASQPVLWFVVTAAFGALGPGGDSLLVPTWQTLLLLVAGVLVGMFCFRRAVDRLALDRASADDPARPLDPRMGKAERPV